MQNAWKGPLCSSCSPITFVQADQGLRCLLTESLDIVVCVNEQRIPRSDCTDVHAHLDLPVHVRHKGLFSPSGTSYIIKHEVLFSHCDLFLFCFCRNEIESINWGSPANTFPRFIKLLQLPVYMYSVLLGLTVSVGGLTESLVSLYVS